MLLNDRLNRSK